MVARAVSTRESELMPNRASNRATRRSAFEIGSKNVPAHEAATINENGDEQQQDTAVTAQLLTDFPSLLSMESIKLDGRPVLCLDVEVAADDVYMSPAETASSQQLLRLQGLLLPAAVVVCGIVLASADVYKAVLVLGAAAVLAALAVGGGWQHWQESTTESIKAAAFTALYRVGLDLAGAVVLTAYYLVAAWGWALKTLPALPAAAATAVCIPWIALRQYLACLNAIAALGDREPCAVYFPKKDPLEQQQEQLQLQAQTEISAAAAVAAAMCTPWTAFKQYRACLNAIATLGDKEPCAAYFPKQQQHQQQQQVPLTKKPPPAAAAAAVRHTPLTMFQQYLACLDAIAALGDKEPCAMFGTAHIQQQQQQQQQQVQGTAVNLLLAGGFKGAAYTALCHLALNVAGAAILTAYLPVATWEWAVKTAHMPAVVAQRYLACLNAIALLGDNEPCAVFGSASAQQQQQQQAQGTAFKLMLAGEVKAAAFTAAHRMALDLAGAVVLTAYLPIATWEWTVKTVHMPAVVGQRYLACLDAIAVLGDKEPCAVFIPEAKRQQQQQG